MTDGYKKGLITGLAMQPLCVTTIGGGCDTQYLKDFGSSLGYEYVYMYNSKVRNEAVLFSVPSYYDIPVTLNLPYVTRRGRLCGIYPKGGTTYRTNGSGLLVKDSTGEHSNYPIYDVDIAYLSAAPRSAHPAIQQRIDSGDISIGKEFNLAALLDGIKPKEIITLNGLTNEVTGVLAYVTDPVSNAYMTILVLHDSNYARLDTATNTLSAGTNTAFTGIRLGNTYTSILSLSATENSSWFYTVSNQFMLNVEGHILYNTHDLCDQNGNVLVKANCAVSDFI